MAQPSTDPNLIEVTVTAYLTVDRAAWALEYGLDESDRATVRRDVLAYWDTGTVRDALVPSHLSGIVSAAVSTR